MAKKRPITRQANAEDALTGDSYEVLSFTKTGDRPGSISVPRDKLLDLRELVNILLRKNAKLPLNRAKIKKMIEIALAEPPKEKILYAAHCGWYNNNAAFVLSNGVIGPKRARSLAPPLAIGNGQIVNLGRKGTLEHWQLQVARRALCSRTAMVVIAAAFAAPLLQISGRAPFGINLFGKAKIGKSSALLVGASVVGIGREADLPNFSDSPASRGQKARLFNDALFPLNEVGVLPGTKKAAYDHLRSAIYTLAEGREAARHTQSGYSTAQPAAASRTIFVFTAEESIEEYARHAGQPRHDGEYARCLDIPALGRRGSIVTHFPKSVRRAERAKWAKDEVSALRHAAAAQHGTAFEPYIEFLIACRPALAAAIQAHCQEFRNSIGDRELWRELNHAADNFALIYAGGRLAIEGGVLPWPPKKLLRAVRECFLLALDVLDKGKPGPTIDEPRDTESDARRILRAKLKKADVVERDVSSSFGKADHDGFWVDEGGVRIYTIHSPTFHDWFAKPGEFDAAIQVLKEGGKLKPRMSKGGKVSHHPRWFEQTPKWPDGKSVRSIVFSDPR